MTNSSLLNAKKAKNDEFYTQLSDVESELQSYKSHFENKVVYCNCDDPQSSNFFNYFASNFKELGLKKLIASCYREQVGDLFDTKDDERGFFFEYTGTKGEKKKPSSTDIIYFNGSGDFRSSESIELLKQSDIVVTNPPFSLFREHVAQLVKYDKKFLIIGSINAITYKEIFNLIKENKFWLGTTNFNKGMYFKVPSGFVYSNTYKFEKEQNGEKVNRVPGVCWFTNLYHGRRHQPKPFMTMEENLKFSKHKELKGKKSYDRYENYDAIDVPFVDAIPSDYEGIMGVPITFLDKYSPDQFEILGVASSASYNKEVVGIPFLGKKDARPLINGKNIYARVFIKKNRKNNMKTFFGF